MKCQAARELTGTKPPCFYHTPHISAIYEKAFLISIGRRRRRVRSIKRVIRLKVNAFICTLGAFIKHRVFCSMNLGKCAIQSPESFMPCHSYAALTFDLACMINKPNGLQKPIIQAAAG